MVKFYAKLLGKIVGIVYLLIWLAATVIFWWLVITDLQEGGIGDAMYAIRRVKEIFVSPFWSPTDDPIFNFLINSVIVLGAIPVLTTTFCLMFGVALLIWLYGVIIKFLTWLGSVSPFLAVLGLGLFAWGLIHLFRNPVFRALAVYIWSGLTAIGKWYDNKFLIEDGLRRKQRVSEEEVVMGELGELPVRKERIVMADEDAELAEEMRELIKDNPEFGLSKFPLVEAEYEGWWKESWKRMKYDEIRHTKEKELLALRVFNEYYAERLRRQEMHMQRANLGETAKVKKAEVDAQLAEAEFRAAKARAGLDRIKARQAQEEESKTEPTYAEIFSKDQEQIDDLTKACLEAKARAKTPEEKKAVDIRFEHLRSRLLGED